MNAPLAHPPKAEDLPSAEGVTPVMAQFLAAKAQAPDAILFFRMGDFYELFFKDAEIAAAALGITLTRRGKHQGEDIPMAGVPGVTTRTMSRCTTALEPRFFASDGASSCSQIAALKP